MNDDSFNDSPDVSSFDLDELNTFIHIGDDVPGDSTSYITLYLDLGDDIKENQAMNEGEMLIEQDDVSHAISGDIPDGYPEDFCPIYEPSFVEMGIRSEDEDFIGYILGAYTVDEFEKVKNFYSSLNPQETTDMGFGKVFVFESENGIDYASVTVMDWQDQDDEKLKDYKTSISISISLGK